MRNIPSKTILAAGFMLAMAFTLSCSSGDDNGTGSDSDKGNDIKNYKTVPVGDQVWMADF